MAFSTDLKRSVQRIVTGGILLAAGVAALLLTLASSFPPYDPEQTEKVLSPLSFGSLAIEGRALHYAERGDPENPLVLFVHGTPGSMGAFLDYLTETQLSDRAHLVAVDRPGFGRSTDGDWLPNLKSQAAHLAALSQINRSDKPMVVVGHSLGGTIAYRMAIDFPDKVSTIVVVSSSIDPFVGQARWYNHLANNKLIRWMIPRDLQRANREIMPLAKELADMATYLAELTTNVTVIHGKDDRLVDYENLEFAAKHLPSASTRIVAVDNIGHFILWERPKLIVQEIERAVNQLSID